MSKVPVFRMSVTNFKSVFKDALDFLEDVFNFYLRGGRALILFMLSLIRNQERQIVAPSNFCHKNNFLLWFIYCQVYSHLHFLVAQHLS